MDQSKGEEESARRTNGESVATCLDGIGLNLLGYPTLCMCG